MTIMHPNANDLAKMPPFGLLQAVRVIGRRNGKLLWRCECACGGNIDVRSSHLTSGAVTSCGCQNARSLSGSKSPRWTGHGEITGTHWNMVNHGARARGIAVEVTIEEMWELFLAQGRLCALTGLLITFGSKLGEGTASLDRIDSRYGYVHGNVQWIHKYVNIMKSAFDQEHFVELCAMVARHKGRV